jgi:hypothetical protein
MNLLIPNTQENYRVLKGLMQGNLNPYKEKYAYISLWLREDSNTVHGYYDDYTPEGKETHLQQFLEINTLIQLGISWEASIEKVLNTRRY